MVAMGVAVPTNEPKDKLGFYLYLVAMLLAAASLAVLIAFPAWAAPARAAQRPLENEILRIAQTAQASTQPASTGVRDVSWDELQQEIASNRGAIVIEFYRNGYPDDPNVADDCDNCANQLSGYENTARKFAGKVTFLRFDVDKHPHLMQYGLVVFPTHIFMVHSQSDLWTLSVRGFLTEKQFEELMDELFKIKP
jgi:hypothetical protein